jgi:hypothetical protein
MIHPAGVKDSGRVGGTNFFLFFLFLGSRSNKTRQHEFTQCGQIQSNFTFTRSTYGNTSIVMEGHQPYLEHTSFLEKERIINLRFHWSTFVFNILFYKESNFDTTDMYIPL